MIHFFVTSIVARYDILMRDSSVRKMVLLFVTFVVVYGISQSCSKKSRAYETPRRTGPALVQGRTDRPPLKSLACDECGVPRQGVLERPAACRTRRGSERLKHFASRQGNSFTQRIWHYFSVENRRQLSPL